MNAEHWNIFETHGLPRGSCRGDKGTYHRNHPKCFFLAGARVCNANDVIWTGDLDLATADGSRLVNVAAALGMTLYVHSDASFREQQGESPMSFALAVVTASGIEVTRWGMSYVRARLQNYLSQKQTQARATKPAKATAVCS